MEALEELIEAILRLISPPFSGKIWPFTLYTSCYRYSVGDVISQYISVDKYGSADIFFIQLIAKNLRSHPNAVYEMLREINEHEDRQTNNKETTFVIEKI